MAGIVSDPLKRDAVAQLVREKIASGELQSGGAAPSGAALALEAGCSPLTARAALRSLVRDGTLVAGVSPNARLRVARPGGNDSTDADTLRTALAKMIRARRRAENLTQPELARKLGVAVTTIAHAETGRIWQSRLFWVRAGEFFGDSGDLVRAYDAFAAVEYAPERGTEDAKPETPAPPAVVLPVTVTITAAGVVAVWPDGSETIARPPAARPEPPSA
jgi:transcriptional regulator with XRE-family HTH domain